MILVLLFFFGSLVPYYKTSPSDAWRFAEVLKFAYILLYSFTGCKFILDFSYRILFLFILWRFGVWFFFSHDVIFCSLWACLNEEWQWHRQWQSKKTFKKKSTSNIFIHTQTRTYWMLCHVNTWNVCQHKMGITCCWCFSWLIVSVCSMKTTCI